MGSASGGFLARSESGIDPRCDKGGWGALRSLGIGLLVIEVIFVLFLSKSPEQLPRCQLFCSNRYSIGLEGTLRLVQTAQFRVRRTEPLSPVVVNLRLGRDPGTTLR